MKDAGKQRRLSGFERVMIYGFGGRLKTAPPMAVDVTAPCRRGLASDCGKCRRRDESRRGRHECLRHRGAR